MYIRRDKSNLHFGRQSRRGSSRALLIVWLVTMGIIVAIIWRFNSVQNWALARVGGDPTATMDSITLAELGERAYWNGDLETSIQYYSKAADLAPQNIDIQFEYGRMLVYRSYAGRSYGYRAEQALEVAQHAVEVNKDNPRAQAILCLALLENGRAEEAIQAGLRATSLAQTYAEAHAFLSLAYYRADRPNQAFISGERAVELDPNSLDARRAFAQSLAYVGDYDGAIQQFERAIQIHPRLDVLYFELAVYYKAQNNYSAAIDAYDRVLMMEPNNVKAYTRKCETYTTMRDDAKAEEACTQAIELDATYPEAYSQLGMIQYMRKNYEGSIESFETCASLQTAQGIPLIDQEIKCYYIRGLAWSLLARCDEAWPVFQDALSMNPNDTVKGFITQGMQLCVTYGDRDPSEIPTPIPTEAPLPEPIGIY